MGRKRTEQRAKNVSGIKVGEAKEVTPNGRHGRRRRRTGGERAMAKWDRGGGGRLEGQVKLF